jgi:tRNA (guanine-N7-)-methyltransferase
MLPDPWPKRRHHRRRIVTATFLKLIHRALKPHGMLRIATDHPDYFGQIQKVVAAEPGAFAGVDEHLDLPETRFEQRFRAAGRPIYRLSLRKVSPVM